MLHCPAHADATPSLSVAIESEKILVKDFGGCEQADVIAKLRDMNLWQDANGLGQRDVSAEFGLTLQQYAKAKHLPIAFLQSVHLSNTTRENAPVVRIPYLGENAAEIGMRYRLSLKIEPRFLWRKNSKVNLYGLWRLNEIRQAGWVLLVEGESDCHTLWHYGLPALGVPGKTAWQKDWKKYCDGLAVYLWQEPDAEDFTRRVGQDISTLRIIPAPHPIKDPSEAHILGIDVPAWLEKLKAEAVTFESIVRAESQQELRGLESQAAHILNHPDPLELVKAEIARLGYGGDMRTPTIVYLAATSRLIAPRAGTMPVHTLLLGQPSGGKSYTLSVVRKLFPEDSFHVIDAGSPRALIYDQADLEHRVVVFGEADSIPAGEDNPAASAIRNLLQEGRLAYSIVVRDEQTGEFTTKEIEKLGPTVLITTATRRLGEQMMTRLFTLEIADDPDQVRAALRTQARIERDGPSEPDPTLIAFQSYLQLRAPLSVNVPYAEVLGELLGQTISTTRILRDFARLMSLIKSVAILRQRHRQVDSSGRIIAEIADYTTVRELVGQMFADSVTGTSKRIRKVVESVAELAGKDRNNRTHISQSQVKDHLGISKATASRGIKDALKGGWLVNHETRKGFPALLALGEPLPAEEGLPEPHALHARCFTVSHLTEANVGAPAVGKPAPNEIQPDSDEEHVQTEPTPLPLDLETIEI